MSTKTEDAQRYIDGLEVAEMGVQFAMEFHDTYPEHVLAGMMTVGPMQAFIGFAIKNGHLVPSAEVAELREQLATARPEIDRLRQGWEDASARAEKFADLYSRERYPDTTGQ